MLNEEEKTRLVNNIAGHVVNAKEFIQQRCVEMFSKCDPDYGGRIAAQLKKLKVHGSNNTQVNLSPFVSSNFYTTGIQLIGDNRVNSPHRLGFSYGVIQ